MDQIEQNLMEQKQNDQANWPMDGTHIGENWQTHKLERFALILCILMAIICGTFLYATFFPTNSSNPGLSGGQNNGHLHKEIEALHSQIGQMLEEAKAQNALEKEHLQLIGELRALVEQQTKESSSKSLYVAGFYILRYINSIFLLFFCFCGIFYSLDNGDSPGIFVSCCFILYMSFSILLGY